MKGRSNMVEILSEREKEVLNLLCKGFTNKEISEILFISIHTSKSHVTSLIHKLGAKNRTSVAYIAAKLGLIDF